MAANTAPNGYTLPCSVTDDQNRSGSFNISVTVLIPLDSIAALEIRTHEWNDGSPSYSLDVLMADHGIYRTGSSWSREEVEALRQRVATFLGTNAR